MTSPRDSTSAEDAQRTGRTVVGLFQSRSEAEDAIRDLKNAGFTNEQIGVATRDQEGQREDRAEPVHGEEELGTIVQDTASGMAEGAAVGALTGGVVGGLVGLIGSLLIPGLGPVVVGGVLASTLMGMGIGAATGGLIGALVGMGVPEEDAKYFDAGFRQGGTLVTVDAGDATSEAVTILQRNGGDLGPSKGASPRREAEPAASGAERFDASSRYAGQERRGGQDVSYSGPERRLVGV
jgi:heat induced stress protein YflT